MAEKKPNINDMLNAWEKLTRYEEKILSERGFVNVPFYTSFSIKEYDQIPDVPEIHHIKFRVEREKKREPSGAAITETRIIGNGKIIKRHWKVGW